MATNKHAIIRYHALDKCFSNFARRFYIEDLILACNDALYDFTGDSRYSDPLNPGISRRQVLVDIDFMESDAGWSALIDRVKDGRRVYYRYEDPEYTINNQPITDEEIAQLRETMLMLSRFKGLPQFEWIDSMITNLEDKFHLKSAGRSVIGLDGVAYADGIEHITPLFNAILNKTPLNIKYTTFNKKSFDWIIHPYYIKQYNNRWFLIGLNNDEFKSITNVALDRIVTIEQASVHFIENTLIEDFDEYFEDIIGVSFPAESTIQNIILRFSQNRFPYIKAKPIHGSQKIKDPESGIITLDVIPNKELESILLSFGNDVEVLAPESIRSSIAKKIKDTYQYYYSMQDDCTDGSYLCGIQRNVSHSTEHYGHSNKEIINDAVSLHK